MNTPHIHDTSEIVIAATRWLMLRYQQTGCRKLARRVEQPLARLHDRAASPRLIDACRGLSPDGVRLPTAHPYPLPSCTEGAPIPGPSFVAAV